MIKIDRLREETLIYLQLIDFFRKKKAILSDRVIHIDLKRNSITERQIKEFMAEVNRLLKVERFLVGLDSQRFGRAIEILQKEFTFGPQLLVSHVSELRKAVKELEKMDPGLKLGSLLSPESLKKTTTHMVCIFHFNEEASRESANKIKEFLLRFEGKSTKLEYVFQQLELDTLQEIALDVRVFIAIGSQSTFFNRCASRIRLSQDKVLIKPSSVSASPKLISLQELYTFEKFDINISPGRFIDSMNENADWKNFKKNHRQVALFDRCAMVEAAIKTNSKLDNFKIEGLCGAVKAQQDYDDCVYIFCRKASRDQLINLLTGELKKHTKEVLNPESESDDQLRNILEDLRLADEADKQSEEEYLSASTDSNEE